MSIRLRAILLIILTNLFIIMFSVSAGIIFIRESIRRSQETDLAVVADIADHFISSEIENIKLRAAIIAHHLEDAEEDEWGSILSIQEGLNPEFLGMTVISSSGQLMTSVGEVPSPSSIIDNIHIRKAFSGITAFSSTHPSDAGMVFYLATPLPNSDNILVLTLPGMYFSERLSTFVIWDTGHIFMMDENGHIIANIREGWVQNRINFIRMAENDESFYAIGAVSSRVVNQETGTGYFSTDGVPRLASFRPVTASENGWGMGIIAPLPESPFRDLDRGLLVVGIVAVVLSIIAAFIASTFVKKPFVEIANLKEAAEANSRYKSSFLANMSHEMRTPLNVVVGLTDLRMEDDGLPGEVQEDLKKINAAGELLLGIVNDVLDISKIEAGKLEIISVNYQTASLFNDIISLNIIRLESKPIKFIVEIDENFPEELQGDELRVKQIFNNLLSNAFKYTREGTIKFIVSSTKLSDSEILMNATVSDTGIGIREEDIKKLFSEYNQVDTEANREIEGTGLGLAITKRLIDSMEGEISVESEYGKGTSFRVCIKQGLKNDKVLGPQLVENLRSFRYIDHKQNSSSKLVRPDLSYARVLVVDDFPTNLDVASGLLRKYKMQVDCVLNGQAAINLIKAGEPVYDVIFMDHMMPEMDGIQATKLIRELDSDYAKKIPIISLTANALVGNEEMFLREGFNAFLSKPINIFRLDSIVKKWVRKKENHIERVVENSAPADPAIPSGEIPGVDMDAALDLYGGEMDILISVLESFAANTQGVLTRMHSVTTENLSDYAVIVHGIKSVCGTIAAKEINKRALKLEMMAKAGDLEGVLAENDSFIIDAETLVNEVQKWLKTNSGMQP
ncbi:MAG: ATP-binding protein [Treponema sp.]|nr:ATP-binding protein [Treponema sp.]